MADPAEARPAADDSTGDVSELVENPDARVDDEAVRRPRRLHRCITGDDTDLHPRDPGDEAGVGACIAGLVAEQQAEFEQEEAREEMAFALHRRRITQTMKSRRRVTQARRFRPRARGAGRPRRARTATRSSARSGDSGDSSEGGESEPPSAAALQLWRTRWGPCNPALIRLLIRVSREGAR
jgi:hypothetical protein